MTKILQIDREAADEIIEVRFDGSHSIYASDIAAILASHREQATRELVEVLRALQRNTVDLYRGIAPGGNYGANVVGSDKNESTFADNDPVVVAARSALTKANPDA